MYQYLTILTIKNWVFVSRWNFLLFNLCLLPLVLSPATTEENLAPSSSFPHIRYLYTLVRCPLSLLFSRLKSPSSLGLSFYKRCSSPFNSLCGLVVNPLHCVRVFLDEVSPVLSKGEGSLPDLLALLFQIQSRILLAFLCHEGTQLAHGLLVVQ